MVLLMQTSDGAANTNMDNMLQEQKQAALDEASLQAEMRRVVQVKDFEIESLLADRVRLEAALASIKGQVTSAASPARSDSTISKPSVRASVDSQTLRSEQQLVFSNALYFSPHSLATQAERECKTSVDNCRHYACVGFSMLLCCDVPSSISLPFKWNATK